LIQNVHNILILTFDYNLLQKYKKKSIYAILIVKKIFFIKNICVFEKKVVPLHPEL